MGKLCIKTSHTKNCKGTRKTNIQHESIQENIPIVRFIIMITCIEEFRIVFTNTIHVIYKVYKKASVHFVMSRV